MHDGILEVFSQTEQNCLTNINNNYRHCHCTSVVAFTVMYLIYYNIPGITLVRCVRKHKNVTLILTKDICDEQSDQN